MSQLHTAVRARQEEVESLLFAALESGVQRSVDHHPAYERGKCFEELMALSQGEDCNYDRRGIGVAYACWYHARRLGDGYRLLSELLDSSDEDLHLIDFGCGTGALWWAAALIESTRQALGRPERTVCIEAVDASPAMLASAREMWDFAAREFGPHGVTVDARLSSWLDRPPSAPGAIAVMSYVFDSSDRRRVTEVGRRLADVLKVSGVDRALIASSKSKRQLHLAAAAELTEPEHWYERNLVIPGIPFTGAIISIGTLRARLVSNSPQADNPSATKSPSWGDKTEFIHLVRASTAQLSLPTRDVKRFVLDIEQAAAATPDGRMTVVLGSAGSGKSRVRVERVVREVERRRPGSTRLRILVTAFNKALTTQLRDWFVESQPDGLDVSKLGRRVIAGGDWTVEFRNFDQVLVQYLAVRPGGRGDSNGTFKHVIENLPPAELAHLEGKGLAFPDFYSDELHRVVYGLAALTEKEYETVPRRGRIIPLSKADRTTVWRVLKIPATDKVFTWEDARIEALTNVRNEKPDPPFDLVFADECQDFVAADFELLHALVKFPTGLSVYGDGAQGLHVGSSHWLPGVSGTRWKRHELSGSYRLPLKACDAVRPLSQQIGLHRSAVLKRTGPIEADAAEDSPSDSVIPEAMKASTLGTRPILITGDQSSVVAQIAEVANSYAELISSQENRTLTLAEPPSTGLAVALGTALSKWYIEEATMLKIKGLERSFVVWSTEKGFSRQSTVAEWIFTILTRSTAVTVIALDPATPASTKAVVGRLDRQQLLFWTRDAEETFDSWRVLVNSDRDPIRTNGDSD